MLFRSDWRACGWYTLDGPGGTPEYPTAVRGATIVKGDVLTHDFPDESFDAVVGISSIEHIGLGHYDADPLDPEGDRHCMERIVRWLKPGGWVYLDVPFDAKGYHVEGDSHRVYDDAAIQGRLIVPGLTCRRRWYGRLEFLPEIEAALADTGPAVPWSIVAILARKGD